MSQGVAGWTQAGPLNPDTVVQLAVFYFEAEELDDRKVQIVPPGFHVIFLPFADDFRKLKLDEQLPRGKLCSLCSSIIQLCSIEVT